MAQAGAITQGMTLGYDVLGVTAFGPKLGAITDWSYGGETRTVIQLGSADSTGSVNDPKPGRRTRGAFTFTLEMDPDGVSFPLAMQVEIERDSATVIATTYSWQLAFSDVPASLATFDGFLTDFGFAGADDGKVTGTITIQLTSDLVFT